MVANNKLLDSLFWNEVSQQHSTPMWIKIYHIWREIFSMRSKSTILFEMCEFTTYLSNQNELKRSVNFIPILFGVNDVLSFIEMRILLIDPNYITTFIIRMH